MFSVKRWYKQFVDEVVDLFMNLEGGDAQYDQLEESKVRTIARMLIIPTKSEISFKCSNRHRSSRETKTEEQVQKRLRNAKAELEQGRAPCLFEHVLVNDDLETWVDDVIPDAPWVCTKEFLDKHNFDYVAHDALLYADASGAGNDVYEFVKAIGKVKETKRTDGISTSDIIRIVKDYNDYIMRNLARGYTRKDLGVNYEKQLRVNMGLKKLRDKVKEHQEKVGEKVSLSTGVYIPAWIQKGSLPPPPPELPLILIGPGTGLLVISSPRGRSIVHAERWRFLCCILKRSATKGQHKMKEKSKRIWNLLSEGAAIYIAGSSNNMPADVTSMLEEIVSEESGVSKESAAIWLRSWERAGRFHIEAWS
ncbi:uncharacterized protein A4U43_C05F25530 [Asparagus officinalis]|uniref:choline-phosphate cytidylyltransferase n=1 Tax=Asparagus officinalis TaxID=4686 RepID=A0A5P1EW06_ASPOF|nr:uncharacterized protein A4U43_C05F25530 [Asparagus officinalis]